MKNPVQAVAEHDGICQIGNFRETKIGHKVDISDDGDRSLQSSAATETLTSLPCQHFLLVI